MNKVLKLKYLRTLVQIIFLIFYPGLFAMAFSQIGHAWSMIINKNFNVYSLLLTLLLAIILVLFTAILGRFFCGWLCSFGTMCDFLYYLNIKLFKSKLKFKINEDLDSILKLVKYVVLLFIFIFLWTLQLKIPYDINPWNSFARLIVFPPVLPTLSIGLILLIAIAIGNFFIERFFCRYLCPLGAIFAIASKVKIVHIRKPKSNCGNCKACTVKCSMGLQLYKVDKVTHGDCINCFKCVSVCPIKNAKVSIFKRAINVIAIAFISIISFFALYSFKKPLSSVLNKEVSIEAINNAFSAAPNTVTSPTATTSNTQTSTNYKAGTYNGEAMGLNNEIQLAVTVSSNSIKNVKIINAGGSSYADAANQMAQEIVEAQSTNVSAISGATYTSSGVLNAVQNALNKATS
ncbi:MAG: 4Fe-4S binding protein [Sarcina sp.]